MLDNLSQSRLKELLHYNSETGQFTWLVNRGRARVGDHPCHTNSKGYIQIQIDGAKYLANRLAWLYVSGEFPRGDCDHKDGDVLNNKIKNLRDITRSGNLQNMCDARAASTSKRIGVHRRADTGKYVAQIQIDMKKVYLGQFENEDAAARAYFEAKKKMHPASHRISHLGNMGVIV